MGIKLEVMQESQALMVGGQDYSSEDETFSLTWLPRTRFFMTEIASRKTWNSSRLPLGSLGTVRGRYGKLSIHLSYIQTTCSYSSRTLARHIKSVGLPLRKIYPVSCVLWKVTRDWRCWVHTTRPVSIVRCILDRPVVKWGQCVEQQ